MSGMTIIPIPQSPIGTVEQATGRIIMAREWYRFFGLLQSSLGGSTNIFADVSEQLPPPEQTIGATLSLLANAIIDASGQAITARAIADDARRRVIELEAQIPAPSTSKAEDDFSPSLELGEHLRSLGPNSYTPTLTNLTNLTASTAYACTFMRVVNTVIVSGRIDVDPTAAGTTQVKVSLPVPTIFAATSHCSGVAFADGVAGQGAAIYAYLVSFDAAIMEWVAVDTANRSMFFIFQYRVL